MLTKQEKEDRLMRAKQSRCRPITLGADQYQLYKWNYDQILRYSGMVIDIVKDLAKSTDPKMIMAFLQARTSELFKQYKEQILEVMSDTFAAGNYSDPDQPATPEAIEEAKALLRVLEPNDLFALFQEIIKDNFSPLAGRLDLGKKAPALNQLLQAMKALISSPSSSPQATPTTK